MTTVSVDDNLSVSIKTTNEIILWPNKCASGNISFSPTCTPGEYMEKDILG